MNNKIVLFAVGLLSAQMLRAQDSSDVRLGERIRVISNASATPRFESRVWGVHNNQLVLHPLNVKDVPLTIPFIDITRIEVRRPTGQSHAGAGALIGTLSGFVLFGAIGYFTTRRPPYGDYNPDPAWGLILAGPGSGIGALAGLLIGHGIKRHHWTEIPMPVRLNATNIK
ncbi:MAG: hypothetical protein ABI852_13870 [Gemmatimonadaceae bacterium]